MSCELGDLGRNFLTKVCGVNTCSNSSASYGQSIQTVERLPDQRQSVIELCGIARPFLSNRQRGCVLKVHTSYLTTSTHSRAFVHMVSLIVVTAGMSRLLNSNTVAICISVGKVSWDDWLIFTSSYGG